MIGQLQQLSRRVGGISLLAALQLSHVLPGLVMDLDGFSRRPCRKAEATPSRLFVIASGGIVAFWNLVGPASGSSLTDWEGVHPAPPVGRQLHGHPGWCEWVDEGPLGGVTSRTDVQGGLGAAHREPAWSAGVPLGVHHLL